MIPVGMFDAKPNDHQVLEHLRKESLDLFNRIHSIAEDAEFVNSVTKAYPDLPVLPNLRCGAWYTDPSVAATDRNGTSIPAYFKSTDGHFGNWSFNLRRANLHLLPVVVEHNGLILVDSTRSGKRIPDALSKTVPIWCSVVNRAVRKRLKRNDGHGELDERLYTPPGVVSVQEHHQIESRLDKWAHELAESSFELPELQRPLRPFWITPANTTFPNVRDATRRPGFMPVICVSASRQVESGAERRSVGFTYVQGSGDDHELWSMDLTPELFWKHKQTILTAKRGELMDIIISLVAFDQLKSETGRQPRDGCFVRPPSKIGKVGGRLQICSLSDISDSEQLSRTDAVMAFVLLPWSLSSTEPPGTTGGGITRSSSYIEQSASSATSDGFTDANSNRSSSSHVLQMTIPGGKRGQMVFLQDILPRSMVFIERWLGQGRDVCVACASGGKDIAVGVALTALQMFFDDEGRWVGTTVTPDRRQCDKKTIRTRLEWIVASRPVANPSRTTLKRVNEFLLTPSSFRKGDRP